jgi:predicted Zn-dependent protease
MTRDEAKRILTKVLETSTADDTVVCLHGEQSAATRYANNTITQNLAKNQLLLTVSTAFGNKVGNSSTNEWDDDSIMRLVKRAETIAQLAPPDPEYMPPLDPQEYPLINAHFKPTAHFGPQERAEGIRKVMAVGEKNHLATAGVFSNEERILAVANSKGLWAYHNWTSARFACTVMTANSSGWAEAISEDIREIDPANIVAKAKEKAEQSMNPKEITPGKYTVILEPAAVSEMLAFLFWMALDAKATDEGRTFLSNKIGKKIVADDVVLRSQPGHPRIPGRPFQTDGSVSPATIWLRNGMVENLIHSRFWAKKKRVAPTGWPSNLIMEGSKATLKDLIESTDQGILVTRFWYIRPVDPMTLLLTGMTRDGTFWIEKGKVKQGIKNLRFNDSPIRMLNNIELIAGSQRTGEYFDMFVPTIKVKDFNFTSKTKF